MQESPASISAWQDAFMRGDCTMEKSLYAAATPEIGKKREELAPETLNAWRAFSRQVFADGALPAKTKDLIAVAVAHVTQCPYCIRAHTRSARSEERRVGKEDKCRWS